MCDRIFRYFGQFPEVLEGTEVVYWVVAVRLVALPVGQAGVCTDRPGTLPLGQREGACTPDFLWGGLGDLWSRDQCVNCLVVTLISFHASNGSGGSVSVNHCRIIGTGDTRKFVS